MVLGLKDVRAPLVEQGACAKHWGKVLVCTWGTFDVEVFFSFLKFVHIVSCFLSGP